MEHIIELYKDSIVNVIGIATSISLLAVVMNEYGTAVENLINAIFYK